ncbi:hypothetical protein [[Pseudomonas] boreopolis]|uniref:Uncharacterized protein n=1 Tax=Xanthomonas boreopolis TaxID=86183 RepID=A0A919F7P4_9XANT|nr:hypothetical protein GCM10009090_17870 [[Pseudomonas] boreopolis]
MLTGKALGDAVEKAIRLKGVPKTAVAAHFGIKGPSIYDWIKHGRVGKQHLTALVEYFSDVVGPEHWGMPPIHQASQLERLSGDTIRAAIERLQAAHAQVTGWEIDFSDPEDLDLLAQAVRSVIADQIADEVENGSNEGSRQVGRIDRAAGKAEAGPTGRDAPRRARKSA